MVLFLEFDVFWLQIAIQPLPYSTTVVSIMCHCDVPQIQRTLMWTEHIHKFIIWSCIRIEGKVSREKKKILPIGHGL